jgi:hypothetical protein
MENAQTIMMSGSFTSDGSNKVLRFPSGVQAIWVSNLTQLAAAQTTPVGVKYFWQGNMANGSKQVTFKSQAADADDLEQYVLTDGFTLVDTSATTYGALNATITAVSAAAIPVVTNTGNNGLVPGDVVRLYNIVGGQQLGGLDFTVGYNTLTTTTFSLDYMAQIAAATTGSWRKINFLDNYYPYRRIITKITRAAQAVVTFSVVHDYQIGQKVRLNVPAIFGMTEMNGLEATIVAVNYATTNGNTITIDVDSSGFTAFAWPTSAAVAAGFTPAEVVIIGDNSAVAYAEFPQLSSLQDSVVNISQIQLILAGGEDCPGGDTGDEMVWLASTVVENRVE